MRNCQKSTFRNFAFRVLSFSSILTVSLRIFDFFREKYSGHRIYRTESLLDCLDVFAIESKIYVRLRAHTRVRQTNEKSILNRFFNTGCQKHISQPSLKIP